jgi:hypothetical protein
MSDITREQIDVAGAIEWTLTYGPRVGWWGNIKQWVPACLEDYPGLRHDTLEPEGKRDNFVKAVRNFQAAAGLLQDGKLGPTTWEALLGAYAPVDDSQHYTVHYGNRIPMPRAEAGEYRLVTWQEADGISLYEANNFDRRPGDGDIDHIVVHWGAHDPASCARALNANGVSSHFLIGKGVVYQGLDTKVRAWHAGWSNSRSIGVDICRQPTVNFLDLYTERGDNVHVMDNPAHDPAQGRGGPAKVLSLDPEVLATAQAFLKDLAEVHGLEFDTLRDSAGAIDQGMIGGEDPAWKHTKATVMHSQVSWQKWDVAPWSLLIWDDDHA